MRLNIARTFLLAAFLLLAATVFGWVSALPTPVQAQTMMTIQQVECGPARLEAPDPALIEAGGEVFELDIAEAAAYTAATSRGTRHIREISMRVVAFPTGQVLAVFVHEGLLCGAVDVEPALHREAIRSLRGQPI